MEKATILACGYHDQSAPRHSNMKRELEEEGFKIVECHTTKEGLLPKLRDMYQHIRRHKKKASVILVTFPGHHLLPFLWMFARIYRKTLWFDIFFSIHEITIDDRRRYRRWHPKALYLWMLDFLGCHLPDRVIIDTQAHKAFLCGTFKANPDKIRVMYVGTRTDLFYPKLKAKNVKPKTRFNVLFYGTYIPHQGVEHIVHAAKLLEKSHPDIHFTLIGKGQTYPEIQKLVRELDCRNISFEPFLPLATLAERIRDADMCLGVLGTAPKIQNVISHKVFDAVACRVPILTTDSIAVREKFGPEQGVYFCKGGDPEAIVKGIMDIYAIHYDRS